MADVVTKEVLDEVEKEFKKKYNSSKKIQSLAKKLEDGLATCEDAFEYSKEVGYLKKDILFNAIEDGVLGDDGTLHYYDAKALFEDTLYKNYELINEYCKEAFTQTNKRANIGLKGVSTPYEQNKTNGIIECAVKDVWEKTKNETGEAIKTNAKSYYDSSVKTNADFQYKSGLHPKIIRTAIGKTCKWCQSLVGTYDYYDVSNNGNDVFRRHANCDCVVVYSPKKGQYKDVWSKKEYKTQNLDRYSKAKELSKNTEYTSRRIGERGNEICDKPTYNRLTKDFIKHGGSIIRGEEASKHLDATGAGASYLPGWKVAFIRDDASVSEVLEEMYHSLQDRKGMFNNYPTDEILFRREIDAQLYLLSVQKRYKMSTREVNEILDNLKYWENKLKSVKGVY